MLKKLSGRERALLVVLAIALIGVVWYLGFGKDRQGSTAGGGQDEVATPWGEPPVVRMDLLASLADPYDSQGRDLFKYSQPPRSQADIDAEKARREAVKKQREEANKRREEAMANRQKERKPPPPSGPRLPRPTFNYIGHLGPKDDRLAVFNRGEEIFLARVGEVVEEDFKLMEIGYQSIVLGFTDPKFEDRTQRMEQKSN